VTALTFPILLTLSDLQEVLVEEGTAVNLLPIGGERPGRIQPRAVPWFTSRGPAARRRKAVWVAEPGAAQ
jgi:hypothetical protein